MCSGNNTVHMIFKEKCTATWQYYILPLTVDFETDSASTVIGTENTYREPKGYEHGERVNSRLHLARRE